MADLYDVVDHEGEFVHVNVEGRTRALALAYEVANRSGQPAFLQVSVDPDEEGSEALYSASENAEEVQPLPTPPSAGEVKP